MINWEKEGKATSVVAFLFTGLPLATWIMDDLCYAYNTAITSFFLFFYY